MALEDLALRTIAVLAMVAVGSNTVTGSERTYSWIPTFSDLVSALSIDPNNAVQVRNPIFSPYAPARVAAVLNVFGTTTAAGRVFMYQEEANTDVIFTATAQNAGLNAGGPFTIEIRTSLSCATPGPIYNPLNVVNGGVVTSTPIAIDNTAGFLSYVKKTVPPTQVNLFGIYNIVGRSVVIRNAAGTIILCGQLIVG